MGFLDKIKKAVSKVAPPMPPMPAPPAAPTDDADDVDDAAVSAAPVHDGPTFTWEEVRAEILERLARR